MKDDRRKLQLPKGWKNLTKHPHFPFYEKDIAPQLRASILCYEGNIAWLLTQETKSGDNIAYSEYGSGNRHSLSKAITEIRRVVKEYEENY